MKNLIIIILFGLSTSIAGQSRDTLYQAKINDAGWTQFYSKSADFKTIKFTDGSVLKIGDKMRIGRPSGTNQSSGFLGQSNISVNSFSYLMVGRIGGVILSGVFTYLPETFKGVEVEIEDIKLKKSVKRGINSSVMIIFNNPGKDITLLDLDAALKYGELINPKAVMTSDEALAELQKAKTKLDLGVISQQEYDIKKGELMKLIK